MIQPGRIPMSDLEAAQLELLLGELEPDAGPVSLTRRDPGELGPIIVHVGLRAFLVDDDNRQEIT